MYPLSSLTFFQVVQIPSSANAQHKDEEEDDDDKEKEEKDEQDEQERTEEGANVLAGEGAVGCRYSCKGELVGWEVTPRVTIEKR